MTEFYNFADLAKQSSEAFAPVPVGEYNVIVAKAEASKTSSQKLMIKIQFKIVGGPQNGRTLLNNITLSPENPMALRMWFLNFAALGLGTDFFSQNPQGPDICAALIGRSCTVTVSHRVWNGETRDNVESMKPSTGVVGAGPVPGLPAAAPAPAPAAAPAPAPAPLQKAETQPATPPPPVPTPGPNTPPPTPAPAPPTPQAEAPVIPAPQNPAPAEPAAAAPAPAPAAETPQAADAQAPVPAGAGAVMPPPSPF